MEGYRLPPVSFTEREANALITAQKLITGNSDDSFLDEFTRAVEKIKLVLKYPAKESVELLSRRMAISQAQPDNTINHWISSLQSALTNYQSTQLDYQKAESDVTTMNPLLF